MDNAQRGTRRAAFAAAAATGLLTAACGGPGGPGGAGTTETSPQPAQGPMELRVTTDTSVQNLPGWENAARGYEQRYPNRKVRLEHVNTGLVDKIIAQQAGGDAPPVFYLSTTTVHNLGPRGVIADLMPLVRADRTLNLKDIPERALKGYGWSGKLYGMPVMADTRYLHYNVSLFKQAGLPVLPKEWNDEGFTLERFVEYAQRLTDPAGGVWGLVHGESWPRAALYQLGADYWDNRDYTTRCVLDRPEAIEAFQWMQDTVQKWRFAPSPQQAAAQSLPGSNDAFIQGKAAMVLGGYKHTAAIFPAAQGFEWSIAPLPKGRARGTSVTVVGFALPTGAGHVAEAFDWIKWTTFQDGACAIMGLASQAVSDKVDRYKCSPLPEWQTRMTQDGLHSGGKVDADHPNVKPEMWTIINREVDRLMRGEQSARDTGKQIVEQVNAIFEPYVVPKG
jgi:multiple sugar transport system substrate-binding protein